MNTKNISFSATILPFSPRSPMQKYVTSSVCNSFKDSVDFANNNGLGLEIALGKILNPYDNDFLMHTMKIQEKLKGFTKSLSVHGFFADLNLGSKDPDIRAISLQRYRQSFQWAEVMKADTVVFHTGNNFDLRHPSLDKRAQNSLINYWADLVKDFEHKGITAVLENVQEMHPDYILDIVRRVDSPNLKICIDTGHINTHSSMPVVQWIEESKEFLHHMHIHNNYSDLDSHGSIMQGDIKFEPIFNKLKQCKLKPKIVFEMFTPQNVLESLNYFKKFFD